MTKNPRSIRLTDAQAQFADNASFISESGQEVSLSEFVREKVDEERVKQACGVCAVCGTVIYVSIHGWSDYGHSSPGGQKLGLDYGERVDLCKTHTDEFMEAYSADEGAGIEYPTLDYVNRMYRGDVKAYMLEVRALMDAQPDKSYGQDILLGHEHEEESGAIFDGIRSWIEDSDASRNVASDEFDPVTVFSESDLFEHERVELEDV